MSKSQSSARLLMLVGLFLLAGFWIVLMGLVTVILGGRGVAGAAPIDDGTVKAAVTHLDRGKDFEISLALKVTDQAGNILENLNEQDIEVYEDGELVLAKNFMPAGHGAIRLALVVDYSTSMNGRKIVEARKAARALIRMLRDKHDQVGLYFFNDPLFDRGQSERLAIEPLSLLRREDAWEAIMFTGVGNGSPMLATMGRALESLSKVSGRKVMIVLTDGMDTGEPDEVLKFKKAVVARSQELRVPLYMVSTSSEFEDEKAMRELAESSGGQYIGVPDPTKLKEIFENIGKSLQNEYTLTYTSPNPVEDGQKRHVTVHVRNGRVGNRAEGDYSVPGVISTGATARRSTGGAAIQNVGLSTLATIFVALTALLAGLSFVPALFHRRAAGEEDAPAAVPMAAPPVRPTRPSAQGMPPRRPGKP